MSYPPPNSLEWQAFVDTWWNELLPSLRKQFETLLANDREKVVAGKMTYPTFNLLVSEGAMQVGILMGPADMLTHIGDEIGKFFELTEETSTFRNARRRN